MENWKTGVENMVYSGRINVPYKWDVGETGSYFLTHLRDKKELWGRRCPSCGKVYVPPLKNCGECFTLTDEWVQVKEEGTLESYTVVHYSYEMQPSGTPIIYGLVRLEGADGAVLHLLGNIKPENLKVGMKVKARFADERKGSIQDILYFEPA